MKEHLSLDYHNIPLTALVAKALGSEIRLQMLKVIEKRPMNISEVAEQVGIPISTTAAHIRTLEEAGLVVTQSLPGLRGHQKVCGLRMEQVDFILKTQGQEDVPNILFLDMPIGNYFDCQVEAPCGIVSETNFIAQEDNVSGFYSAQKHLAQLIWFSKGYLEYRFTNYQMKRLHSIEEVEFSLEVCSEAPAYNNTWKSDITVWINHTDIGFIRCMGDYGGRKGAQNPGWWSMDFTQYGKLHAISITRKGCFIDGIKVSEQTIETLQLLENDFVSFRIGMKETSKYVGGMNLFGEKFGDTPQNIQMKISY